MASDELQDLQEHAEHGHHDRNMSPVSLTMAVLAVLVAVAALLGHRAHTEELVLQTKSTDQWAYYQAKNIRRHNDEFFVDLTSVTPTTDAAALAKLREKYSQEAERYKGEQKDIEAEARKLEQEVSTERNRADRIDLAEVFLEVGLVITSITLLSGRRIFWHLGIVLGVVGVAVAVTARFVH
jgi:Domain of unknown function (DUF4337)